LKTVYEFMNTAWMEGMRKEYIILVGKLLRKQQFRRPRRRWGEQAWNQDSTWDWLSTCRAASEN